MPATRTVNRLINEKSPYLLQHAHNPVNWYPWGDEAFTKAKEEDKPVFLSIGYSTCHWCHVMERESFEDEEVAQVLNKNFVAVKVDREERPDIDTIYMAVCQTLTGHGGWPLTVFLTPDKKPFYAGTYFPKNSRHGMPGLLELLDAVHDAWVNKKDELISSGNQIAEILEKQVYHHSPGELDRDVLQKGYAYFEQNFDSKYGGFGSAPKFPTPHQLMFLLRYYKLTGEKKALFMVEKTLESMYLGGIYDHIGFGFDRYSTNRKWLVPHFEKMLYDNALLAIAYGEAYQMTGNKFYSKVVEEIFTYILRDMTSLEGGFYCAEDEQKIVITEGNKNISLTIGSTKVVVDGKTQTIDVPAKLLNGRTMVPLRFISQVLGQEVNWVAGQNGNKVEIAAKNANMGSRLNESIIRRLFESRINEDGFNYSLSDIKWQEGAFSDYNAKEAVVSFTDGSQCHAAGYSEVWLLSYDGSWKIEDKFSDSDWLDFEVVDLQNDGLLEVWVTGGGGNQGYFGTYGYLLVSFPQHKEVLKNVYTLTGFDYTGAAEEGEALYTHEVKFKDVDHDGILELVDLQVRKSFAWTGEKYFSDYVVISSTSEEIVVDLDNLIK
jgi:hypothetical protein